MHVHKPDTSVLKNHLPANGPVLHKGHAVTAVMIVIIELTVHALELSTLAITVTLGTFGKDLWDAIDVCVRKCSVEAQRIKHDL